MNVLKWVLPLHTQLYSPNQCSLAALPVFALRYDYGAL